jgi:hypothetical protein
MFNFLSGLAIGVAFAPFWMMIFNAAKAKIQEKMKK